MIYFFITVNNYVMKNIVLLIVITFSLLFLVGCGGTKNADLIIKLEINYNLKVDSGEKIAINEIEKMVTKMVLVDYTSLNEDKIKNLCECILEKWNVENELCVELTNKNLLQITIGNSMAREVKASQIMLPLQ